MSFKDSPKPPTALQKTKALSLELAEETEETVSLLSDSVSINSTITLENLPLNPSRLLTPPWSTEDTPSSSVGGGVGVPSLGHTSGWSTDTEERSRDLDWVRLVATDTTRSANFLDCLLARPTGALQLKETKIIFF